MIENLQYFTERHFAESLVSLLDVRTVSKILDLGIGDGALSLAALDKWNNSQVDAVDIDYNICSIFPANGPIKVVHGDVIKNEGICQFKEGTYDLALCNPPYERLKKNPIFFELFEMASLPECKQLKSVTADLVFVAQNLKFLRQGGLLAIIIPDGLLTRNDYQFFRQSIIEHHKLIHIIQLPEKAFSKTEARTHIIIVEKGGITESKVKLSLMDPKGIIRNTITVDKEKLILRMDYQYCNWAQINQDLIPVNESNKINTIIKRGSYSYKELRELNIPYLHSNCFSNGDILSFPNNDYSSYSTKIIAKKGDIIICRVGKRCVGKMAFIQDGNILISDCLFLIRTSNNTILFKILSQGQTNKAFTYLAHGVCSRVISKSDLLHFIKTYF